MATEKDISEAFSVAEPVIQERYHRLFSRNRMSHRYDTDDLVQQTFYRACLARHQCQGQTVGAVVNWILKIAANTAKTAITHNKKTKRRSLSRERQLVVSRSDERPMDFGFEDVGERSVMNRAEVERLLVCLDRLPQAWQRMVVKRYLMGMSFLEIADELGYTESSVRGSILSAVSRLRREMRQKSLPGFEWSEEERIEQCWS